MTTYGYIRQKSNPGRIKSFVPLMEHYSIKNKLTITEYITDTNGRTEIGKGYESLKNKLKDGDAIIVYELSFVCGDNILLFKELLYLKEKNVSLYVIEDANTISGDVGYSELRCISGMICDEVMEIESKDSKFSKIKRAWREIYGSV